MASHVMDASAVLAMFHREPGEDVVRGHLAGSVISAVNVAEVGARLADHGVGEAILREALAATGLEIVPFDAGLAFSASALRATTRRYGLSFGDRACLALARQRNLPALTGDRGWARVEIDVSVRLIR